MENLNFLNDKQKEAVTLTEGPLLIIAGPGSGKTRTLVERVSYILNFKNAEPKNILLATFTEKAARELITRVSENINKNINISDMYIGTIHSICLRIIDENIERSLFKRNYKVLDSLEQRFFIYTKLKKFENIDGFEDFFKDLNANNRWKKAGILQKWIDKISEDELNSKKLNSKSEKKIKFLYNLYFIYKELLFEENAIDFSNIQLECYRMLFENKELLEKIQQDIKYVMVDEYQDTNIIQEKLFLLIAGERKNICVVGDDDQGIYRFRGATVKNILKFQNNFSEGECRKIELNINYRSNEDIVNFCNLWNEQLNWDGWRYNKNIVSGKEKVNHTLGVVKISENTEYKWQEKLCRFIYYLKRIGKIEDYNQIAFLFRSVRNFRVLNLMEEMERRGIPVYSPRSNMFFKREEIKFFIGLFLMSFHQVKELVFDKNYGIADYYRECFKFAVKKIEDDRKIIDYIKKLREKSSDLKEEMPNFLGLFYSFLGFKSVNSYLNWDKNDILLNRSTYNFGILSQILKKFDDLCGVENLNEKNINKVLTYLFNIHLKFLIDSGVSEYEDIKEYAPKGAVSFLTVHQGKGLEFPCVIVGSLEEYPTVKKYEEDEKLEADLSENFEPEYRIKEFDFWRTYYTAFSRAQNLLALTCIENSRKPVPSIPFKRVYEELKDVADSSFEFQKLSFENVKKINIKEIFAFTSHINLYELCPRLYKFQKKFGFVAEKNKGMVFGILIHETLEDINRIIYSEKDLDNKTIKNLFDVNYKNLYKKYKINFSEEILEKGLKTLYGYYENEFEIYNFIKDIEIKLSFVKEDYILEGIADLVIEKNEKLQIVDFKTGKRGKNEERYINQLEIYAYLLNEKYGREIEKGILYYIGEKEESKIVEVKFTEERLKEAVKNFDDIAKKIISDNYESGFKNDEPCSSCSFKEYCFNISLQKK